jgi:hypothetical protein
MDQKQVCSPPAVAEINKEWSNTLLPCCGQALLCGLLLQSYLTFKTCTFCSQKAVVCFVYFLEQREIISLTASTL